MNCSVNRRARVDLVEAGGLLLDRFEVEIFQFGLASGASCWLSGERESAASDRPPIRETPRIRAHAGVSKAAKAAHALRHIGLETDPVLLAVIADVDPGCHCFSTTWRTALSISEAITLASNPCPLPGHQQIGQFFVARQAADMGGQNAVPAEDHERALILAVMLSLIRVLLFSYGEPGQTVHDIDEMARHCGISRFA